MKRLIIIVNNYLDNDSRVIRISDTLSLNHYIQIAARSKFVIKRFFTNDLFMNFTVKRFFFKTNSSNIKEQNLSKRNSSSIIKSIKIIFHYPISCLWEIRLRYVIFMTAISQKADIIYCNDFDTLISGYFVSRRKRAKLIYDSHELWSERNGSRCTTFNRIKRIIEYIIEWFLIKKCYLVITVSNGIANELSKRYNINKPYIIRNLDEENPLPSLEERMKIRDKLNIPHDCILIVYQGSLLKNRGIPELIESMDNLPKNIHLLLMGKFISRNDLIKVKSNSRIHFPGMIPKEVLFNHTACADIGIAPIRTKGILSYKLAFPNKFSQYMNAGLALALYDIQSSREIIGKYDCGVVFESGSSVNIVKAINDIINSEKLEYYKANSRKGFVEEYNWDIDKHKLIEMFGQI